MTPRDQRHSEEWEEWAEKARSKPGEWLLVRRDGWKATAHQINTRQIVAFREGNFRAVTRRRPDRADPRTCDIYLAYLGEPLT